LRTESTDGLLLLQHKSNNLLGDYLAVALNDGYVEVTYNLGKESPNKLLIIRSQSKVNDGKWHTLLFNRYGPKTVSPLFMFQCTFMQPHCCILYTVVPSCNAYVNISCLCFKIHLCKANMKTTL